MMADQSKRNRQKINLISLLNRPLWYMVTLRYFDHYGLCYSHGRLRGFTRPGESRFLPLGFSVLIAN